MSLVLIILPRVHLYIKKTSVYFLTLRNKQERDMYLLLASYYYYYYYSGPGRHKIIAFIITLDFVDTKNVFFLLLWSKLS